MKLLQNKFQDLICSFYTENLVTMSPIEIGWINQARAVNSKSLESGTKKQR